MQDSWVVYVDPSDDGRPVRQPGPREAERFGFEAVEVVRALSRCECGFAGTNVTPEASCGCCGKLVDERSMRWLVENALANYKRAAES